MPYFMGDNHIRNIHAFRTVYYDGRNGGGKTLLAVRDAYEILNRGWARYCVSNIPLVFADNIEDIVPREGAGGYSLDVVCILDEAGQYIDIGSEAKKYMRFLRKANIFLLMPSLDDVATILQRYVVERQFNAQVLGVNAYVYQTFIRRRAGNDKEKFILRRPTEVYGLYDTDARPVDDMGIAEWLQKWNDASIEKYYGKQGRKPTGRAARVSTKVSTVAQGGGQFEEFAEAAQKLEQSNRDLSLSNEGSRKRRR